MNGLAMNASDVAHHLLMDYALKGVIVAVALIVLALGMAAIWRWAGRGTDRRPGTRG
ncbi:hypothetical protein AB0C96_20235 [Streptomyces sp. NPDC048506]|uniref:hypothetical protein n=1 Tax=Streptomyces sp. NPDC048506 TaxID=3155028 RepID=UPI0034360389